MGALSHLPEARLILVMRLFGDPVRLRIILGVGSREVCLCHILARVRFPKRYVQRQLMQMKEAGFICGRRRGIKTFYRLADPSLLEMIATTARLTDSAGWFAEASSMDPIPDCPCPECNPLLACPRDSKKDEGACRLEDPQHM